MKNVSMSLRKKGTLILEFDFHNEKGNEREIVIPCK